MKSKQKKIPKIIKNEVGLFGGLLRVCLGC